MMKRIDWKGLTAQEIATIPNDEFRLQTVERILKERNTHPVKDLTQNITGVWRLSDQSIQIVFTSCRSASEFVELLRKAQEK